jgi:hypothetical protein
MERSTRPRRRLIGQLERELLKTEILRDLKQGPTGSSALFKHPAMLLLLGFVLTTLAGGWLTFNWQSREWYNQQLYIARQRELDRKYAITDEVAKDVGESITAADDVLAMFFWEGTRFTRKTREAEARSYWQQSSRAWRINSSSLAPKLAAHFRKGEVRYLFDVIVDKRTLTGNKITNLLVDLDTLRPTVLTDPEIQRRAKEALGLQNELRGHLRELTMVMVLEIQEDGVPSPLPSLVQTLKHSLR